MDSRPSFNSLAGGGIDAEGKEPSEDTAEATDRLDEVLQQGQLWQLRRKQQNKLKLKKRSRVKTLLKLRIVDHHSIHWLEEAVLLSW